MKKVNVSQLVKSGISHVSKHSPGILLFMGISGMISSAVMVGTATPKALQLLEEEKEKKGEELTPVEKVKAAWKPYVPAAVTGVVSIGCVLGSNSINTKRNAALAAAYTLSEKSFSDYKAKVIETMGEKKEQSIKDAVAKAHIERNPVVNNEVIITEKGNTLCYDVVSGRYFKSDIEKIRKIENDLNKRMMSEMYISLNDLYCELGLKPIAIGYELGWNINREGSIDIGFSSQISDDGTPCLVIDFQVAPRYDYTKLW